MTNVIYSVHWSTFKFHFSGRLRCGSSALILPPTKLETVIFVVMEICAFSLLMAASALVEFSVLQVNLLSGKHWRDYRILR